jgi:Domain of unknown function (DUF4158)
VPSVHETAYPRLNSHSSPHDLATVYTPSKDEVALAEGVTRRETARLAFLLLLKTFQRLGYFVQLRDVPRTIVEHIAHTQGFLVTPEGLADYDASGTRRRHVPIIRAHQRVHAFGAEGQVVLRRAVREAAHTKEDLADIINVAIEELVRQGFELPGFTTLQEEAQRGRAEVNRRFYAQVYDALGAEGRQQIDGLWAEPGAEARTTAWNSLKQDVGSPTLTHLKALVDHHQWLSAHQPPGHILSRLPTAKMDQFAAEARSLDAARMQALEPHKRYTLAAVLLWTQWSRALDDLGQMFIKRMMRIHRRGKEALALHHLKPQERTERLETEVVGISGLTTYDQYGTPEHGRQHHRRDVEANPIHAVVVRRWQGKGYGPGGKTVFLTNASVQQPLHPCDAYDERSLIENCCIKEAKQQWDLGHPPQKTGRAVWVHVVFTFLMFALATAYRLRCEQAALGVEPVGWQRWRRQLLEQTRDKIIVFAQPWYGIFHLAEFALLVGVKLKDVPPGIGTPQQVLTKYTLTAEG